MAEQTTPPNFLTKAVEEGKVVRKAPPSKPVTGVSASKAETGGERWIKSIDRSEPKNFKANAGSARSARRHSRSGSFVPKRFVIIAATTVVVGGAIMGSISDQRYDLLKAMKVASSDIGKSAYCHAYGPGLERLGMNCIGEDIFARDAEKKGAPDFWQTAITYAEKPQDDLVDLGSDPAAREKLGNKKVWEGFAAYKVAHPEKVQSQFADASDAIVRSTKNVSDSVVRTTQKLKGAIADGWRAYWMKDNVSIVPMREVDTSLAQNHQNHTPS